MSNDVIKVGTRGSLLARTQTDWVLACLKERHPDVRFRVVVIRTSGDVHTQQMPARFAGKGFFTKEIEDALIGGSVDLAVHSLKDLPTGWPQGLTLGAVPPREDPRDALVGCTVNRLSEAPGGLRIGTSSLRRAAQLRRAFPGCNVVNLRGNLDTRLRKVSEGVVDCAVLAAAGLRRLARENEVSDYFTEDQMLPAPGQGALAVEIRSDDERLRDLLAAIHCSRSASCVAAERAFMNELGGGCQLPVAAWATVDGDVLRLSGRVLSVDGMRCLHGHVEGTLPEAEGTGKRLAGDLQDCGAGELIAEIQQELEQGSGHE